MEFGVYRMAIDSLTQLGKTFDSDNQSIQHVSNRYTKNFPLIEKSLDIVTPVNNVYMEFYTYGDSSVFLDVSIFQQFRPLVY